jgi:serine/threonine-protein kinase
VTFLVLSVFLHFLGVVRFWRPGMESHLVATLIALAVWRVARLRSRLARSSIQLLDTLGTLGICVSLAVMGHRYAASQPWGAFAGIFAVFHVTMARAVIVPSTSRRTLVVTGLCFAGLVVSQRLLPPLMPLSPGLRWLSLIPSMTWSATVTALATMTSKVVYGLQEKVIEARQLGQYTLEEKIGAGGMGEVYRARHAMLRRPTAVKLLSGAVSDVELRRFEKEVQLTALLTHPNTISIYDYGRTPEGTFYYAMELLEGMTLEQLVERYGALPPRRAIHILLQICGALREAHEAGLIHRDVKPANVILCWHGGLPDVVKVLDFGLVKQATSDAGDTHDNQNAIVGTPLYMSPEEISSPGGASARSDLYAVGAVAYYLLSGTPVFSGKSIIEVCSHHLHTAPLPLSERASQRIPSDLEDIVLDCLAKDPEARPPSAYKLAERLRACADAGSWTELDARSWWQAHVEPDEPPPPRELESRTLRIDLETRGDLRDRSTYG